MRSHKTTLKSVPCYSVILFRETTPCRHRSGEFLAKNIVFEPGHFGKVQVLIADSDVSANFKRRLFQNFRDVAKQGGGFCEGFFFLLEFHLMSSRYCGFQPTVSPSSSSSFQHPSVSPRRVHARAVLRTVPTRPCKEVLSPPMSRTLLPSRIS